MRLLLDSHILLWSVFEPQKLFGTMQEAIANTENLVCVSIVSMWEIAIKQSIGRLIIPEGFFDIIYKKSGFDLLLLQPNHISHYLTLPLHHRDPFDRMLIAQAKAEQLTLVTNDEAMMQYEQINFF